MTPLRVLACTVAEAEPRLRRVLPDADITVVLTMDAALETLKRDDAFDLLLVGMRFDESRALEFVERIHNDPAFSRPPIVGIRGAAREVVISPRHFDLPMWAMGACDVIDLSAVPNNDVGNRNIRERLIRCVRA
jgi:CheY-like chemotaxis protein